MPQVNCAPLQSENVNNTEFGVSLTQELVLQALISPENAQAAEGMAQRLNAPIADVLTKSFGLSHYSIALAQAKTTGAQIINPVSSPPDPTLVFAYGPADCLQHGVLPWRKIGAHTVVLSSIPHQFDRHIARLTHLFGPVRMAIATDEQLCHSLASTSKSTLVDCAETRTPAHESCRNWRPKRGIAAAIFLIALTINWPLMSFAILAGWAVVTLALSTLLKAVAAVIGWREKPESIPNVPPRRLPTITMLVPLYNETAIAEHLLARLNALNYPHALLDICLVLEESDATTRATLGRTVLPTWIRPIIVPRGSIKTKPRALNYALDFARGSIIGVWDAEDAPAQDQLMVVAQRFDQCAPEVACLQGKLDYYNASSNWLTRCFTIEYAGWFRVILPGLQRMGLAVPLGGTTLFFRREALDRLGGWDAHNVTEDADLGIRLARHGYRTELIDTVTEEEANGRAWPWVKQRSRWLKGYAITYGVHMRHPLQLWRDLGAWRFFGVQILFLGTLSQFVLAPFLWSFILPTLGFPHPLQQVMPTAAFWALTGLFIASECVGFCVALVGLQKAKRTWLTKWALTLPLYFPLGALAAYKGLWELVTKPFYWDKTAHGVLLPKASITPPQLLEHQAATA